MKMANCIKIWMCFFVCFMSTIAWAVHETTSIAGTTMNIELDGCTRIGEIKQEKVSDDVIKLISQWQAVDDQKKSCTVTETWRHTDKVARVDIEILGQGKPWSCPIIAKTAYPATNETKYWTAWNEIQVSGDPFIAAPLADKTYIYGAAKYDLDKPNWPWYYVGHRPNKENYFSIPIITLIEPKGKAVSVIASPEHMQFDMELDLDKDGTSQYIWTRLRISQDKPVKLSMDIVEHENDWRCGLKWMADRYANFFEPRNPKAHMVAGGNNYARMNFELDIDQLKKMGFTTNWQASYDFPYMGMFLPPVKPGEEWKDFKGGTNSLDKMEKYAKYYKNNGFHVLNYFNVTEFGARIKDPKEVAISEKPDWRNANEYLFGHFKDAIIKVPEDIQFDEDIKWPGGWAKTKPGGFFYTWGEGIAVDPGDPTYKKFLLEQAKRHVKYIPSASGIAIDRTDWLRIYNLDADDGISWYNGAPARSQLWSWRTLMGDLSKVFHDADKVIFVNNLTKRLDLMEHVDGILDEIPHNLIGDAFLGVRMPVMVFFGLANGGRLQQFLYYGIYPHSPLTNNDHGCKWGTPEQRQPYLDYGHLFIAMRGREWVLEPHCIESLTPKVRANLFKVPDGSYIAPVVYGKGDEIATIKIRNIEGLENLKFVALHPAKQKPVAVESKFENGEMTLQVPLHQGCAMVKATTNSSN